MKQKSYQSAIFDFLFAKFVMCCPRVTPETLFITTVLAIRQGF